MNPELVNGHFLWPDGTITVDPSEVTDYIFQLSARGESLEKLFVSELSPEIQEYNLIADLPLKVKETCQISVPDWSLPEHYKYLDLDNYLLGLVEKIENDDLYEERLNRLSQEIYLFKKLQLDPVLKTLIYVLDVMRDRNVVWGVGRGSSCSSYLLYLLGLHEVDPVKYDIDITDFIREEI